MVPQTVGGHVYRPEEAPPTASAVEPGLSGRPDSDRPSAYIPGDRRRALARARRCRAASTGPRSSPTSRASRRSPRRSRTSSAPQRASEALTGHLNRVFHAVIAELDRYGGDVIYFSGDAITCWLDGDDGLRARRPPASRCRRRCGAEGEITTPGGLSLQLALKVAVAVGPARRFVVGDPEIQLIDVLAGRARRPARRRPSSSRERARSSSTSRRSRRSAARRRSRATRRVGRGGRASAWSSGSLDAVPETPAPHEDERRSRPSSRVRGCCPPSTSGSRPAAASSSPSCGRPIPMFVSFGGHRLRRRRVGEREARRVRPRRPARPRRATAATCCS